MSTSAAALSENLAMIVAPEQVIAEPEKLQPYRIGGIPPAAAVRPGSIEEVAAVVRLAATDRLAVVPVGAGSKLTMTAPAPRYDVALDVTRLDKIVSYDAADLTLSVEAGMPLHRLASELAKHGQFVPLAVPFSGRATVGGTIASGVDSPLRQAYGTARDFVLGMEFVTGEGKIVKSGGRVVKNVSGYDLHKLLIGSFGSLGVITKINFRTFPIATSIRAFVAAYDSVRDALEARHRIAQSSLRPLTLEILSPRAAALLSGPAAERTSSSALSSDSRWSLSISYAGTDKILKRYEADLRQLAGTSDCELLTENDAALLMARLSEFVSIALESSPATVIVKVGTVPSKMAQILDDAIGMAASKGVSWAALARGVGVIYFALLPSVGNEDSAKCVGHIINSLYQTCAKCDSNVIVQWIPEDWRASVLRGSSRCELSIMRKLKSAFDPLGVFASDPLSVWE